jgi:hypothetical protein
LKRDSSCCKNERSNSTAAAVNAGLIIRRATTIKSAATAARLGPEISEVSADEEHTGPRGGRRIEAEVRCPAVTSLGPVG